MSVPAGNRSIPSASFSGNVWFNLVHILPNFLSGLFLKRRRATGFFTWLGTDRRTVAWVGKLRQKHGGLVWVRVFASKALLVLDRDAIREVLARSPRVYAEPKLKRQGMAHFQPDALTLSRGAEWKDRRRFTEAVVETGHAAHRYAESFLAVVRQEVAALLARSGNLITWPDFEGLFEVVTLRIVFGHDAGSERELSQALKAMMRESNRVFGLKKSKHFDAFYAGLRRHLDHPAPESLVALAAAAPSTADTRVEGQLPHWMFALADTLAANTFRALALIAAHPEVEARLRGELQAADLDDPRSVAGLKLAAGCLEEAMRLWPTTPLLSRESLSDDMLGGAVVPAGTQILILNLFNHRDSATFPFADRFTPEIWQDPATRERFHHFSGGVQVCPGIDLARFVGQAVLASLLAGHHFELEGPRLDPSRPLPHAYSFFKPRFKRRRADDGRQPSNRKAAADLAAKVAGLSLDDLGEMSLAELEELFLWASTPTIRELDGETDGRALAGELPADRLPWMPWKGKVFEPLTDTEGRGTNRIESSLVDLLKFQLFEFKTRIVPALKGQDDVVLLDYDLEENNALIRRVRDDLKKLKDGLFLGTANLKEDEGYRFVLYFALELKR